MRKTFFLLLIAVGITSCATAPPKYSSTDVSNATTRQEQMALYRSLEAEIAASSSKTTTATYQQLLNQVGTKLGTGEAQRIRQNLDQTTLASGHVPLNVISAAEADAKPIQKWNPAEYTPLSTELSQARTITETALNNEQSLLKRLTNDSDRIPRVECLGRISDLYGDNSQADMAYKVAYEDAQGQLKTSGDEAVRNGDFYSALRNYQDLKRLDPKYPGIDRLLASAQTGIESADFRQLLIDGDVEGAYAAFLDLSGRPLSQAQKVEFYGPANNLAQYFDGSASDSLRAKMYTNAYIYMKREMSIRAWLNESSQLSGSTVARFTDSMFELADASSAEDKPGLEYGYLILVEEFNPTYATLESRKRETGEIVYDTAIRRVGSVSIDSPDTSDQQIASQIAAGVRQYLMENIPEDVKIVERAKLEEIKRERTMNQALDEGSSEFTKLESADFLIEGELLKADVATEVNKIRNRKRVVTGEAEASNPEFEAWIKKKGKRKADHPDAPPKTILVPVQEDIELNYEEHRKFGEVGVTYWVIDTTTAEHLHSASVSRNLEVLDQTREGVQYGDFVQEAKPPQLPSDIEIYTDLVDQIIAEMAADLVNFLANPEGDYFDQCKVHAEEGENTEAAEQCAKAAVLREFKSLDNEDVVALLKTVTLGSNMRAD
jgi:hypothetical protein